ncbi:signal peptidase I (plasmid) [Aneurinibacillus sp. Ricciae_BoGa-3]|uniref:signal peptidase I n=1 Tax=Aneurinibacillus sp. Ricciae_BoGa-3 TaxID=3022697 RepID=UPI0023426748|nr:signal peptidase I [Aneurinibacillus sp. Ricciae_BoGa-3]WCK57627.1 signal peptidase I [Aneurinibacillus sp. Ricciae_BoGa-3]
MEPKLNEQEDPIKPIKLWKEVKDWLIVIVIAFLVAIIVTTFVKPTLVMGTSMYPTLHDKDYLMVNRTAYHNTMPHYKDIVVFNTNLAQDKVLIKRVIAVAGDRIQIKDGKVTVNNNMLNEPYIHGQQTIANVDIIVPSNKIFVMGDNRGNSLDSRFPEVGLVDKSQIIGKIMFRVFPINQIQDK